MHIPLMTIRPRMAAHRKSAPAARRGVFRFSTCQDAGPSAAQGAHLTCIYDGVRRFPQSQSYSYDGREVGFDRETNLNYNYFRDYDPQTGRYVQSDPIGLLGGINGYTYVENNPLSLIDPDGLDPFDPLFNLVYQASGGAQVPQSVVNFGAGLGNVLLFGQGNNLRQALGISGGVNECSAAYNYGQLAASVLPVGRLAYVGASASLGLYRLGSRSALQMAQTMSNGRATIKYAARIGPVFNWAFPPIQSFAQLLQGGKSLQGIMASAVYTNPWVNSYFGAMALGTAYSNQQSPCGCQ